MEYKYLYCRLLGGFRVVVYNINNDYDLFIFKNNKLLSKSNNITIVTAINKIEIVLKKHCISTDDLFELAIMILESIKSAIFSIILLLVILLMIAWLMEVML